MLNFQETEAIILDQDQFENVVLTIPALKFDLKDYAIATQIVTYTVSCMRLAALASRIARTNFYVLIEPTTLDYYSFIRALKPKMSFKLPTDADLKSAANVLVGLLYNGKIPENVFVVHERNPKASLLFNKDEPQGTYYLVVGERYEDLRLVGVHGLYHQIEDDYLVVKQDELLGFDAICATNKLYKNKSSLCIEHQLVNNLNLVSELRFVHMSYVWNWCAIYFSIDTNDAIDLYDLLQYNSSKIELIFSNNQI